MLLYVSTRETLPEDESIDVNTLISFICNNCTLHCFFFSKKVASITYLHNRTNICDWKSIPLILNKTFSYHTYICT